jgi:Tfp pilus assembly protein FimT
MQTLLSNANRGFSLLELLLVFFLMASLSLLSVGPIKNYLESLDRQRSYDHLKTLIDHMRWKSMMAQGRLGVCGSSNLKRCDGHWALGVMAFNTENQEIISTMRFSQSCSLQFSSSLGRNESIVFTSAGMTEGQQGHFYCHVAHSADQWRLDLKLNGSTRLYRLHSFAGH